MRAVWIALLALLLSFDPVPSLVAPQLAFAQSDDDKPKKKRRRKRRRGRRKAKREAKKEEAKKEEPPPPAEPSEEEKRLEAEKARVEAAKAKREAEGRKTSALQTGAPSRWSNRGAMEPIVAEVPVTAPIPVRNVPKPVGVETPGQKLFEGGEVLSARLALSGMQLATRGQNIRYDGKELQVDADRDLQVIRGRATLAYQRIAGSEIGAHLDLEYRPSLNATRFTDQRVNEMYVSYGLTDFRGSRSSLPFGVALGRLAIREAGYAQADGLAFRVKVLDELHLGAFGGITGNPYGYNWNLRTSEFISADWYTGGVFSALRLGRFAANVAGVLTYANPAVNPANPLGQRNGLDRMYASVDASYLVTPDLNFFAQGIIDFLPNGQLVQNLELTGTWSPTPESSVALSVGRFSTVVYEQSTGYTYEVDAAGNKYDPNDLNLRNRQIVDENGNPIVPFDAAIYSTIYNQARLRGGYRILRELELYGSVNALLRDFGATNDAIAAAGIDGEVEGTPFRLLPGVGARYRNPDVIDANIEITGVIDERSNTDAILAAGLGRELFGLYLSVDGRRYLGAIQGTDGGINLAYTFPRDWLPGLLLIRGTARYFQENLRLVMPILDENGLEVRDDDGNPAGMVFDNQQSVLLFAGVEWRL